MPKAIPADAGEGLRQASSDESNAPSKVDAGNNDGPHELDDDECDEGGSANEEISACGKSKDSLKNEENDPYCHEENHVVAAGATSPGESNTHDDNHDDTHDDTHDFPPFRNPFLSSTETSAEFTPQFSPALNQAYQKRSIISDKLVQLTSQKTNSYKAYIHTQKEHARRKLTAKYSRMYSQLYFNLLREFGEECRKLADQVELECNKLEGCDRSNVGDETNVQLEEGNDELGDEKVKQETPSERSKQDAKKCEKDQIQQSIQEEIDNLEKAVNEIFELELQEGKSEWSENYRTLKQYKEDHYLGRSQSFPTALDECENDEDRRIFDVVTEMKHSLEDIDATGGENGGEGTNFQLLERRAKALNDLGLDVTDKLAAVKELQETEQQHWNEMLLFISDFMNTHDKDEMASISKEWLDFVSKDDTPKSVKTWVNQMWADYDNGTLLQKNPTNYLKLMEIGFFAFDLRPRPIAKTLANEDWTKNFNFLKEYQATHRNLRIPSTQYPELADWTRRLKNDLKDDCLPTDKLEEITKDEGLYRELMNDIGSTPFIHIGNVQPTRTMGPLGSYPVLHEPMPIISNPTSPEQRHRYAPDAQSNLFSDWTSMIKKLTDFKERNGHVLLPSTVVCRRSKDPKLVSLKEWTLHQIRAHKFGYFEDKKTMWMELNNLGFPFRESLIREDWEQLVKALGHYKERRLTVKIPLLDRENRVLGGFVNYVRKELKNGSLDVKIKRALEKEGLLGDFVPTALGSESSSKRTSKPGKKRKSTSTQKLPDNQDQILPPLTIETKRIRREVVDKYAAEFLELQKQHSGRQGIYGRLQKLVRDAQGVYPWLNSNMVKCRSERIKANEKKPRKRRITSTEVEDEGEPAMKSARIDPLEPSERDNDALVKPVKKRGRKKSDTNSIEEKLENNDEIQKPKGKNAGAKSTRKKAPQKLSKKKAVPKSKRKDVTPKRRQKRIKPPPYDGPKPSREIRKAVIEECAIALIEKQEQFSSHKERYGQLESLVSEAKQAHPWLTDNMVRARSKRIRKKREEPPIQERLKEYSSIMSTSESPEEKWGTMYSQLAAFKEESMGADLPSMEELMSTNNSHLIKLKNWVSNQQKAFHEGKFDNQPHRLQALQMLGIEFEGISNNLRLPPRFADKEAEDELIDISKVLDESAVDNWGTMYSQLAQYASMNGTAVLPTMEECLASNDEQLIDLKDWIMGQKTAFRDGEVSEGNHRIQALQALGVDFYEDE